MHTESLTTTDRNLLRRRTSLRGRMFLWLASIAAAGLLAFTAAMVIPPVLQGYEFRDLNLVIYAWAVAAVMFVLCYLLIGLFERSIKAEVREDLVANLKEVRVGKIETIDESAEPEPTSVVMVDVESSTSFGFKLRTVRELSLMTESLRSQIKAGHRVRVEIAPHSRVVLQLTALRE
jgi:hypothetical protein